MNVPANEKSDSLPKGAVVKRVSWATGNGDINGSSMPMVEKKRSNSLCKMLTSDLDLNKINNNN